MPVQTLALNPLEALTSSQRERSATLATAMAGKFSVEASAFSIVHHEVTEGVPQFTVVYAATTGVDVDDRWENIQRNVPEFLIEVDGEVIDTRRAMTEGVYRAMITQVLDRPGVLPDRPHMKDGLTYQSSTWLTGEPRTARMGSYRPLGQFNATENRSETWEVGPWYINPNYTFRPAVTLE